MEKIRFQGHENSRNSAFGVFVRDIRPEGRPVVRSEMVGHTRTYRMVVSGMFADIFADTRLFGQERNGYAPFGGVFAAHGCRCFQICGVRRVYTQSAGTVFVVNGWGSGIGDNEEIRFHIFSRQIYRRDAGHRNSDVRRGPFRS